VSAEVVPEEATIVTRPDEPPSTNRPRSGRPLPGLIRADFEIALTPALVPPVYLGLCVLVTAGGLVGVVAAFGVALWLGLLALVMVPVLVLGAVAVLRMVAELTLAVTRTSADVSMIAAQLPRLESTVSDVANDIPRFGLLKLLNGPRGR
jgi:hypothetical protein